MIEGQEREKIQSAPVRFHACNVIAINYTPVAETANVSYLSYHLHFG